VVDRLDIPLFEPDWGADEELLLLEAIDHHGPHAWERVAEAVGAKSPDACRRHYHRVYWGHADAPLPRALPSMEGVDPSRGVVSADNNGNEGGAVDLVMERGGGGEAAPAERPRSRVGADRGGDLGGHASPFSPGKGKRSSGSGAVATSVVSPSSCGGAPAAGAEGDEPVVTRSLRAAVDASGPGSERNAAELTGFCWRRQEFDHEWDNEAELPLADLGKGGFLSLSLSLSLSLCLLSLSHPSPSSPLPLSFRVQPH